MNTNTTGVGLSICLLSIVLLRGTSDFNTLFQATSQLFQKAIHSLQSIVSMNRGVTRQDSFWKRASFFRTPPVRLRKASMNLLEGGLWLARLTKRGEGDSPNLKESIETFFGGDADAAYTTLEWDHLTGTLKIEETVKEYLQQYQQKFGRGPGESAIADIYSAILTQGSLAVRHRAAQAYIKAFPDDDKFEQSYAYTVTVKQFTAHLFLRTEIWAPPYPYENWYDDMIAGFFFNSLTFIEGEGEKGDRKPYSINKRIYEHISKSGQTKVLEALNQGEWTAFNVPEKPVYINERKEFQDWVALELAKKLATTSETLKSKNNVPDNSICYVIGHAGCKKELFIKRHFGVNIKIFSTDALNEEMQEAEGVSDKKVHYHWEAVLSQRKLFTDLEIQDPTPAFVYSRDIYDTVRFADLFKASNRITRGKNLYIYEIHAVDPSIFENEKYESRYREQWREQVATDRMAQREADFEKGLAERGDLQTVWMQYKFDGEEFVLDKES